MSIQSEITRITQKRDASLTAVSGKGVTVPSGSTIDDLPDLIDLIVVEPTYSVSKTLSNVTSSNDDTKVIAGGSFYADLTPTSGYSITNVTVTMGGVDVTEQVFKPGVGGKGITANGVYSASDDALSGYDRVVVNVAPNLGAKSITANGTYAASSDSLDGYSSVTVNVPTGGDAPELQNKTATYTPTTSTQTATIIADTGYDGLSSVGITVNPIPSEYVVPSGSQTITENGTYDVTNLASAVVSVDGGGSNPFSEFTAAAAYNTANACLGALFPERARGIAYFATIYNKPKSSWVDYQLMNMTSWGATGTAGGGVRWRTSGSGSANSFSGLTTSNTAKIAAGDTYLICAIDQNM